MTALKVHIGAHKTGTSLLQGILSNIAPRLARVGTVYDPASRGLGAFVKNNSPLSDEQVEQCRAEIRRRQPAGAEQVVWSSESLFGSLFGGYSNIGDVANDLARIVEGLFDSVTIVAYTRAQEQLVESTYQQHIKQGGQQGFQEFMDGLGGSPYRWDGLLDRYADIFGREHLCVRPFESIRDPEVDFVGEYMECLGVPLKFQVDVSQLPVSNPSLSNAGLEILRRSSSVLDDQERYRLREFLERSFARRPGERLEAFPLEQREKLMQAYRESNEALFEKYLRPAGYDTPRYRKAYGLE